MFLIAASYTWSLVLNVHRRRLIINGTRRTLNICTRCLRTMNKLPKPAKTGIAADMHDHKEKTPAIARLSPMWLVPIGRSVLIAINYAALCGI